MPENKEKDGQFGAMKLIYHNQDHDGNKLSVYKGASLKGYPQYIADNDATFYIETLGRYRFTLKDQLTLQDLVLGIVVIPERRKEKAQLFIDNAIKHITIT